MFELEVFGMPGAGKTTTVRWLRDNTDIDAHVVLDRPEPESTTRRRARRIRDHIRGVPDPVRHIAELSASHPGLLAALEQAVLADDPRFSRLRWDNLLHWMARYRHVSSESGTVILDAGWCQRACGLFSLLDDPGDRFDEVFDVMPHPAAAVAVTAPVPVALARLEQRGFWPQRYAGSGLAVLERALHGYRALTARAVERLRCAGVPVLDIGDGSVPERAASIERFVAAVVLNERASGRVE